MNLWQNCLRRAVERCSTPNHPTPCRLRAPPRVADTGCPLYDASLGRWTGDQMSQSRRSASKAADLGGKIPLPSIARFGRLAYPMCGEATTRTLLGLDEKLDDDIRDWLRMRDSCHDMGAAAVCGHQSAKGTHPQLSP